MHGHTSEELARKTKDFVSACAEAGITLNNKKISYDKPEVVFGGYLISEAGYSIISFSHDSIIRISSTKIADRYPIVLAGSGWNAVMLAPVSGNASICRLVPS